MKYTEGGRLVGSIGGGALGGFSGVYITCNMIFGLETAGTSLLWCGLVAGAAGAYTGANMFSKGGEKTGVLVYEVFEND